jgi:hypothetical protein
MGLKAKTNTLKDTNIYIYTWYQKVEQNNTRLSKIPAWIKNVLYLTWDAAGFDSPLLFPIFS